MAAGKRPADVNPLAANTSTLIFIDLSGSTGAERADGKSIQDSFMADIRKLIRSADGETFTIIGFGSFGGDGRLPQPYGQATRIICESATPAEVRKCLKDDSLWRSMGGTRFPSRGLMNVLRYEMFSRHNDDFGVRTYPSKTIILTDAYESDMLPASWDAESFGAEEVPDFYMITFEIRDGESEYYHRTIVRPDIANLSDEELIISLSGDDEIYEEGYRDYWWVFGEQLWRVDSKKAMSSDTKKLFNDYGLYAESFGAESKFDKLAKEIAEEYEEKGKSPKEAMEIGEATAAKIGRAKFGKKKFAKMGRKAESFSAPIEGYWGQTVDSLIKDLGYFKMNYSGDMPVVVRDGIGWSGVGNYDVSFQEFQTTPDKLGGDEYDSDRDEIRQSEDKIDALAIVKAHNEPVHVSRYGAEDDIDFDEAKADRNKDGRISDWERAVGNAVAKGIRDHKGAEVGPHVPTRIGATTTPRGVVKTYTSIPAGDGHVVGQFTPDMDYAPSGVYGAETITDSIAKGFGSVLGIMSGLIIGGFAMNAVSKLSSDDEN